MPGETIRSHTPDDQPKARLLARTEEGSVFLMPNGDLGFIAPDCTDELEPQIRALPEPGGCGVPAPQPVRSRRSGVVPHSQERWYAGEG